MNKSKVQCVVKENPFQTAHRREEIEPGQTLAEIVEATVAKRYPRSCVRVSIDGQRVDRARWARVRPRAGHSVIVAATPMDDGGGGSSGSFGLMGIFTNALSSWLGFGTDAGAMESGDEKKKENTFSIKGARNQSRHYEPVRRVYGLQRIAPDYAAEPYTEIIGDDQYLRMLFVVGYGPLRLTDLRIGETPIEDFEGAVVQVRYGFPNDSPTTLYPSTVITTSLGILLDTTFATRTSEPSTDELGIVFSFKGLVKVDKTSGDYKSRTVTFTVQYQEEGGSWSSPLVPKDANGAPIVFSVTNDTTDQFTRGWTWDVENGKQYEVRVKRDTEESTSTRVFEEATWSELRSIRKTHPVNPDRLFKGNDSNWKGGLATVALKLKATDELNGVVDTFNLLAESIVLDYDAYSLNFASATASLNAGTAAQALLHGDNDRTIECWALAKSGGGGLFDAGVSGTNGAGFGMALQSAGTETWRLHFGGSTYYDAVLVGSVDAWHHYALTYDGTTARLCYDGDEVWSQAVTLNTGARALMIGEYAGALWKGNIRQFRVWSSYRTEATLAANMGLIESIALISLLSCWPLSEGSGTTYFDYGRKQTHIAKPSGGPAWSSDAGNRWEPRPTRNPAAHYRDILQGSANKRALADSRVALSAIETWSTQNDQAPYTCNYTFESKSSVEDALALVARTSRASFDMRDSYFSVVRDAPDVQVGVAPVQIFTPRNSDEASTVRVFLPELHGLKMPYRNEESDFKPSELIVYADGYDADNATMFESKEIPGITNHDQVWKHGRYLLATRALRPETFSRKVGYENLVCTRGDLVAINDDVLAIGLGFGRVNSISLNGSGYVTGLSLDGLVPMETGKSYVVRVRRIDGTAIVFPIETDTTEDLMEVVLQTPTNLASPVNIGDLYVFGEAGKDVLECIVTSIEPESELAATITMVPAAPAIHTADTTTIPEYDPLISIPRETTDSLPSPIITSVSIKYDKQRLTVYPPGLITVRLKKTTSAVPADVLQWQYKASSAGRWSVLATDPGSHLAIDLPSVEAGKTYHFRVRYATNKGRASAWVLRDDIVVEQTPREPPQPVTGLELTNGANATTFQTRNADFAWRNSSSTTADAFAATNAGAGTLDPWFSHYKIQIWCQGLVARETTSAVPRFSYTWEMNRDDNKRLALGLSPVGGPLSPNPQRNIEIRVWAVDKGNAQSEKYAGLKVSNPAPNSQRHYPTPNTQDLGSGMYLHTYSWPVAVEPDIAGYAFGQWNPGYPDGDIDPVLYVGPNTIFALTTDSSATDAMAVIPYDSFDITPILSTV